MAAMGKAAREVMEWPRRAVQIYHHNDSDGLSSGALLTLAFERKGFEVDRFSLEKPYPEVLRKIYRDEGRILVFADFAGRIAPLISDLNRGRNLTLILDHHVAEASTDALVHNLDPDLFGLRGDRDISASTTCYLFTQALDEDNRDLAALACVGAVGDAFYVDGCLVSENRAAAMEAASQGTLEIREAGAGERYIWKTPAGELALEDFTDYLDILGGVGYYRGGPDMGVRVCREGLSDRSDRMVEELKSLMESTFETEMARLGGGELRQSSRIQWFDIGDRFQPMGVKTVGLFCHLVSQADFVDPGKYIAGYQLLPNEIPGFGQIEFNQVKISMRVPSNLEMEIRDGRAMGLDVLLPEATGRLGGFFDACHYTCGAATVATGREGELIDEMEAILENGSRV